MSFRLVPKSMTLNGVTVVILRYSAEFDSFWASYVKIVGYRPILSETKMFATRDTPCQ